MLSVDRLLAIATDCAAQQHIQKFDIYGAAVDDTGVQVDQGEPKQVKASSRSSVTVRVWHETGRVGITSTTDLDEMGLALALATAKEASALGVQEHAPDFSPEATAPLTEVTDRRAQRPSPAPIEVLVDKLLAAERALIATHSAIQSVPYNGLTQRDVERFYLNSEGALRQEARSYASVYLYSKTEQEGKKPRSAGAYRVDTALDYLDIDGCLREAAEKTISHLDYFPISSGKYPVVFSGRAFLSLLSAFSNLFNAQSILDRQSLASPEMLGETIANPLLCVYDDALHPENVSAETFDGEGTPTRKVALIEQGVLSGFLHSAGTAKRLNAALTGHANLGAKVTVSPHFYQVQASSPPSLPRSLDTADNVVWIDELHALHAGVQSLQGSFSLPFDGWLLKNGDRISIDSATVAGDFLALLKAIDYIDAEPEITPNGLCPKVWVDSLSITGE